MVQIVLFSLGNNMKFNVIYTNDGPRTPSGSSNSQTLAGVGSGIYMQSVSVTPRAPLVGNKQAAAVIQSNGEDIGNAQLPSNPLPPGITA